MSPVRAVVAGFIALVAVLYFVPWAKILGGRLEPIEVLDSQKASVSFGPDRVTSELEEFARTYRYGMKSGTNRGGQAIYAQLTNDRCTLYVQQLGPNLYSLDLYQSRTEGGPRCDDVHIAAMVATDLSRRS